MTNVSKWKVNLKLEPSNENMKLNAYGLITSTHILSIREGNGKKWKKSGIYHTPLWILNFNIQMECENSLFEWGKQSPVQAFRLRQKYLWKSGFSNMAKRGEEVAKPGEACQEALLKKCVKKIFIEMA